MSQSAVRKSKHQQIFESLSADIRQKRFGVGDKLPAEAELAGEFGASRPTVARAVRELVRQGLVVRRVGAGTFVREPGATEQMVFGMLVPTQGDSEIFDPICKQIGRTLQSSGHTFRWADGDRDDSHRLSAVAAEEACQDFIESGVSGVFFVPFLMPPDSQNPNVKIVEMLETAGVSVVLLDRDVVSYPDRSKHDLVAVDHMRGSAQVTSHLAELGHQRVEFWMAQEPADTMKLRLCGVQHMASQIELEFGADHVRRCDPTDREMVGQFLKDSAPTAIICQNDVYAAHLLRTLFTLEISVPEDLSVVGYDDVKYSSLLHVALTTVAQPCEQLGVAAAQVMLNRSRFPDLAAREVTISPKLVVRESTSPPKRR